MSYWDSSALVKLYVQEADSAQFESLALSMSVTTSDIGLYRARTMFRRREADNDLPAGQGNVLFHRLLTNLTTDGRVFPDTDELERAFGEVLETCFSQTSPLFIRTNDALHLATARVAGETEFITADVRQKAAAVLLGFTVLP